MPKAELPPRYDGNPSSFLEWEKAASHYVRLTKLKGFEAVEFVAYSFTGWARTWYTN